MDATFRETAAEPRTEAVALSHLSLELGHLYMDDFAGGPERLRAQFARVAPWARAARETCLPEPSRRAPRISSCFLIDDYFTRFSSPVEVVPLLLGAARDSGLDIDYLARESGCAAADGVPLAAQVAGRLSALPPPGTNGSRPPALEVGWLCNGQRSPGGEDREAMRRTAWRPPVEVEARNHSVFVDVELWHDREAERTWSCAYLAAVWQMMRLGLLRAQGRNVVHPRIWDGAFPDDWDELPPLVQLNPDAQPFCAYRTSSILPARFLPTEHAVRVILDQVVPEDAVTAQITARSAGEGTPVPLEITDRIDYVFFNES